MDFLRNALDYLRGNNTKRDEENKIVPIFENDNGQNIVEATPRDEMDIELPQDFINRTFGGNKSNDDISSFHLRNNEPFFGDFSTLFQIINHFEDAMNAVERHFGGSMGFHNFPEANIEDMRDGLFRESEKTLTGERLRNYYLNGNNADTYQGENQIVTINDKESDNPQAKLIINNRNSSDFTIMSNFKSQVQSFTKIGPDGVAEITTIVKDDSGNEERTVRRVKLF